MHSLLFRKDTFLNNLAIISNITLLLLKSRLTIISLIPVKKIISFMSSGEQGAPPITPADQRERGITMEGSSLCQSFWICRGKPSH